MVTRSALAAAGWLLLVVVAEAVGALLASTSSHQSNSVTLWIPLEVKKDFSPSGTYLGRER